MKNKIKVEVKSFDTVKTFRGIKEKISIEIGDMTFDQIKEYLRLNSSKFQKQ